MQSNFFFPRRMTSLLIKAFVIYGVICALMWGMQRKFLYMPDRAISIPAVYGLEGFTDIRTTTADGMRVQLWYHPPSEGYPLLVYFHGNGGHLGYRVGYFHAFTQAGLGVLALSYRGYGASAGAPTEEGLYADARAALDYATRKLGIKLSDIVLFGESLGTGVASKMATEYPVGALILQAPFTSAVDRGAEIYPWLPVRLLMKDRFDTLSRIAEIKAPLLLLHGERDSIVPISHGKAVFSAAAAPKHAEFFPDIGHNDFPPERVTPAVLSFLRAQKVMG